MMIKLLFFCLVATILTMTAGYEMGYGYCNAGNIADSTVPANDTTDIQNLVSMAQVCAETSAINYLTQS